MRYTTYPTWDIYSLIRNNSIVLAFLFISVLLVSGCGKMPHRFSVENGVTHLEKGVASWYGPGFNGKKTANGETYDQYEMTAAHKFVPLGTWAVVTNLDNGKQVKVRINDRGPFVQGRIIDLSYSAAQKIDMVRMGTAPVEVVYFSEAPQLSDKKYFVQTGAFTKRDYAALMEAQLQKRHNAIQVVAADDTFKVLIGPYDSRGVAEREKRIFLKEGYEAFVIAE
jgi:rare lipoprotein A